VIAASFKKITVEIDFVLNEVRLMEELSGKVDY
jgi:hypothetical protein